RGRRARRPAVALPGDLDGDDRRRSCGLLRRLRRQASWGARLAAAALAALSAVEGPRSTILGRARAVVSMARSHSAGDREPGQVRKEAALSGSADAQWGHLAGAVRSGRLAHASEGSDPQ